MKYVYIALLVVFAVVILVFSYQNRTTVTVSFLSWSTTLPQFVFVIGAYLLGMASGGTMAAFLRHSVHEATKQPGSAAGGRGQQANWHGLRPSLLSSALTMLLAALAAAVVQVRQRRLAHLIQAIPQLRQRRRTQLLALTDALRWIVDVLIVSSALLMLLIKDITDGLFILGEDRYAVEDTTRVGGVFRLREAHHAPQHPHARPRCISSATARCASSPT